MAELRAKTGGVSVEQAYGERAASIAAGRLGTPQEFGASGALSGRSRDFADKVEP